QMFGWESCLGHLCSGGTMANLEALWIAGQLAPGKKVLASQQAHYTHRRISQVLKLEFEAVPCDHHGRLELAALRGLLDKGNVGTVVVTLGTPATGSVDPVPEILRLRDHYNFRLHADAAYGGYFGLADNLSAGTRRSFTQLGEADSIVIDPHKHGLQPYGCGCVPGESARPRTSRGGCSRRRRGKICIWPWLFCLRIFLIFKRRESSAMPILSLVCVRSS